MSAETNRAPCGKDAPTIQEIRERHAEWLNKVARRKRQETPGELRQYTAAKPTH